MVDPVAERLGPPVRAQASWVKAIMDQAITPVMQVVAVVAQVQQVLTKTVVLGYSHQLQELQHTMQAAVLPV
jgi:hypothetical protein